MQQGTGGGDAATLRRALGRASLGAWASILLAAWTVAVWFGVQPEAHSTLPLRLGATMLVVILLTVLCLFPLLLLWSFLDTEQTRAEPSTLAEVQHYGWTRFEREIRDWYRTVFSSARYPVPVTLTIVTFLLGWMFLFFHAGPQVISGLAASWRLDGFVAVLEDAPPVGWAFLGAYFFSVVFLFKRYMAVDLGPTVFVEVCMRTWIVVLLALALSISWELLPHEPNIPGQQADGSTRLLEVVVFLGALTPSTLVALLTRAASSGLGKVFRRGSDEIELSVLQGMNPWKSARLSEVGVDNVQNLAMTDPSKLVVVTQEGGMRVLDWVDQAILFSYIRDRKTYNALVREGVRTAYDLYINLRSRELVHESDSKRGQMTMYKVCRPADNEFGEVDSGMLRTVLLSILHHPNFEKIKQMREQATRETQRMFPLAVEGDSAASTAVPAAQPEKHLQPEVGAVLILNPMTGRPVAMATLVDATFVLATFDVRYLNQIHVQAYAREDEALVPVGDPIEARLASDHSATRLVTFRLTQGLPHAASLASMDPALRTTVAKRSFFGPLVEGPIIETSSDIRLETSEGSVVFDNALVVAVPSRPGDAGAPLVNAAGEIVGITVGGSATQTLAVPASAIRTAIQSAA